ncbi:hypothetical protein IQ277_30225 [Nostocales cyanobacterium LEGE 12452]|nr:hypothetical protein [Nostocales cyanobacterium LEGE 12452]
MISLNSSFSSVAAVTAAVVAYLAYRLQVRTKDQEWYENFNNLYVEFWNDPDIITVRSWIACSEAYSQVETIFQKRLVSNEVSASEYPVLEKVDKFCSLMIRISELTPEATSEKYENLLERLYFGFWIEKLKEREYLCQYVTQLWPRLLDRKVSSKVGSKFLPIFRKKLPPNKYSRSVK